MKYLSIIFILIFSFSAFGQTRATLITEQANLRTEPNSKSPVVRALDSADVLYIKSKDHKNGWYEV